MVTLNEKIPQNIRTRKVTTQEKLNMIAFIEAISNFYQDLGE